MVGRACATIIIDMSEHRPKFDFVYAHHAPANHARIIDALRASDGDVLAVEATGESRDERRAIERVINRALDPRSELRATEIGHLLNYGDGFIDRVVTAFEDSGKIFSLIDISSEHRVTELVGHIDQLHGDIIHKMWNGASHASLRDSMRAVIDLDARAVTIREQVVLSQLMLLAEHHRDQTITVFQGADHTRTSHALARIAMVHRRFVPLANEPIDDRTSMRFTAYDRLLRMRLFNKDIPDADIDTVLDRYADILTS